ncbi:MAG: nucleoside phosphorylase [Clostridia bacterium]|nr:nucleoside phosphorylase [Clostridia bacterium]
MIFNHEYPICEFDTERKAVICAADFLEKVLPEKCVLTFFRKELNAFVQEHQLPQVGYMHSEILDIPIYLYESEGEKIAITMPFQCSAGAAGTLEEMHAMGCNKFIICGGAGCLTGKMAVGQIMLPISAVRDEGASYHYLPPSREVEAPAETLEKTARALTDMGVPFTFGKTWTTDAFYRETKEMVEKRRAEGCSMVEMETAGFYAVAKHYDLQLAQLLYAGDDVSGEAWDNRSWNSRKGIRANLIDLSVELVKQL